MFSQRLRELKDLFKSSTFANFKIEEEKTKPDTRPDATIRWENNRMKRRLDEIWREAKTTKDKSFSFGFVCGRKSLFEQLYKTIDNSIREFK